MTSIPKATALTAASGDHVARFIEAGRVAERRSNYTAALKAFERALTALGSSPLTTRHADVLRFIGTAYRERGETERAEHYYRWSLEAAEASGYMNGVAHAVNWLAVIAVRRGELSSAEEQFQIASRKAHESGDARLLGMIEQNLGVLANIRGDMDAALVRYRAALTGFRTAQDLDMMASVLNNIGVMQRDLKRWSEAEVSFDEARTIATAIGNVGVVNSVELNLAELAAAQARWQDVEKVSRRASRTAHAHHNRPREAEALRLKAMAAREGGRLSDAERFLGEANAICVDVEDRLLEAQIARDLGDVMRRQARLLEARAALSRARELFDRIGAALELTMVDQELASLPARA
jgi:tetratricopeptide (TPR) repeat protein